MKRSRRLSRSSFLGVIASMAILHWEFAYAAFASYYNGDYYQDISVTSPEDASGAAMLSRGGYDDLYCRVEIWIDGGHHGAIADQQWCSYGSFAQQSDSGDFCGYVSSKVNAWYVEPNGPWTVYGSNPHTVSVENYCS
jgi:hypothetical protein